MTVEISEEVGTRLRARAHAEGLTIEGYLDRLLPTRRDTHPLDSTPVSARAKYEMAVAELRDYFSKGDYPPVPEDAFSSEHVYGDAT